MEALGQGDVVVGPERNLAEARERCAQQAARGAGELQPAAQHLERLAVLGFRAQHLRPERVEGAVMVGVGGREPGPGRAQAVEAVVVRAGDGDHLGLGLQQLDEGQEELAVDAVLVELVRRAIGRGHQDDAVGEQGLEQPAQDHRVGDVGDLELVEAEQARLGGDYVGHGRDRVVPLVLAEAGLAGVAVALAPGVDQAVRLAHEDVEVGAPLLEAGGRFEEQVHQHGLAAPDGAHEVDAVRGFVVAAAQHGQDPALGLVLGEVALEADQRLERGRLGRIGPDHALSDTRVVGGLQGGGHHPRLMGPRPECKERPAMRRVEDGTMTGESTMADDKTSATGAANANRAGTQGRGGQGSRPPATSAAASTATSAQARRPMWTSTSWARAIVRRSTGASQPIRARPSRPTTAGAAKRPSARAARPGAPTRTS